MPCFWILCTRNGRREIATRRWTGVFHRVRYTSWKICRLFLPFVGFANLRYVYIYIERERVSRIFPSLGASFFFFFYFWIYFSFKIRGFSILKRCAGYISRHPVRVSVIRKVRDPVSILSWTNEACNLCDTFKLVFKQFRGFFLTAEERKGG